MTRFSNLLILATFLILVAPVCFAGDAAQVQIEAKIAEVGDSFSNDLGVHFGQDHLNNQVGDVNRSIETNDSLGLGSSVAGASSGVLGSFGDQVGINSTQIDHLITEIERTDTLSQPRVTFRNAILDLQVTPQITNVDRIVLDLTINHSNDAVLALPEVIGRQAQTAILVHDGQTIALGGLLDEEVDSNDEKLPFF